MPAKAKNRYEQDNLRFEGLIENQLVVTGIRTHLALADRLGISDRTLRRWIKCPGKLSVENARRLKSVLRIEENVLV